MTKARAKRERQKAYRFLRRTDIARSMDLQWSSLRSHLADAVKCKSRGENERWHAECVFDYAHTMRVLSVELFELTKQDFPLIVSSRDEPI